MLGKGVSFLTIFSEEKDKIVKAIKVERCHFSSI